MGLLYPTSSSEAGELLKEEENVVYPVLLLLILFQVTSLLTRFRFEMLFSYVLVQYSGLFANVAMFLGIGFIVLSFALVILLNRRRGMLVAYVLGVVHSIPAIFAPLSTEDATLYVIVFYYLFYFLVGTYLHIFTYLEVSKVFPSSKLPLIIFFLSYNFSRINNDLAEFLIFSSNIDPIKVILVTIVLGLLALSTLSVVRTNRRVKDIGRYRFSFSNFSIGRSVLLLLVAGSVSAVNFTFGTLHLFRSISLHWFAPESLVVNLRVAAYTIVLIFVFIARKANYPTLFFLLGLTLMFTPYPFFLTPGTEEVEFSYFGFVLLVLLAHLFTAGIVYRESTGIVMVYLGIQFLLNLMTSLIWNKQTFDPRDTVEGILFVAVTDWSNIIIRLGLVFVGISIALFLLKKITNIDLEPTKIELKEVLTENPEN